MKNILYILILLLISCELPDNEMTYQEGLVVFGQIELFEAFNTLGGEIKNVRVSMSSNINSNITNATNLYINDAIVEITGVFNGQDITSITLESLDTLGQYTVPESENYQISPNSEYTLNVNYNNYQISATTTTPDYLQISSVEDTYTCEECSNPTIYGQTSCENQGGDWNSDLQTINTINVNNYEQVVVSMCQYVVDNNLIDNIDQCDQLSIEELTEKVDWDEFDSSYINPEIISSIELSRFGCDVGSFASKPYFVLDIDNQSEINNPNLSAIRVLSYALDSKKMDLEPINNDGTFFDYNQNNQRDSTRIQTFYDTTDVFKIWKGPYLRDENYNPYLPNPFLWTVETSPTPIMWLYFNYYGKHLIVIQASDDAYYDYLSGDPLGNNPYLLPDSNIEGGYGLFTANYSKAFFINVNKAD